MISIGVIKRAKEQLVSKPDSECEGWFKVMDIYTKKEHSVRFDQRRNEYSCTCWWYANREVVDQKKYTLCSHIVRVKMDKGDKDVLLLS